MRFFILIRKIVVNSFLSILGVIIISFVFTEYFENAEDLSGKKVIIIGASSGIGEGLARKFSSVGCEVGLVARRLKRLEKISSDYNNTPHIKRIDISDHDVAIKLLTELIEEMKGVDIVIINSGIGIHNSDLQFSIMKKTIDVNVLGFAAMTSVSMNHFFEQNQGHLVGISSIVQYRGMPTGTYSSTKAFVSNFMQGIRHNVRLKGYRNIFVTDVQPGFVETELTKKSKNKFWVASKEEAAEQIYDAIARKKKVSIVTKRWWLFAMFFRYSPDWLFEFVISSTMKQ